MPGERVAGERVGSKEKLWLIIGGLLLVMGILSYLAQQQEIKRQESSASNDSVMSQTQMTGGLENPALDAGQTRREERRSRSEPVEESGFVVDPVRGVVRKDEGASYFQ